MAAEKLNKNNVYCSPKNCKKKKWSFFEAFKDICSKVIIFKLFDKIVFARLLFLLE